MSEIRRISHQRRHWWAWVSWYAFYYIDSTLELLSAMMSLYRILMLIFLGKGSQVQALIQAGT
jgi:fumarate reductase subunit C